MVVWCVCRYLKLLVLGAAPPPLIQLSPWSEHSWSNSSFSPLSHEIKFWRAKEEETGFARRVQTKRPVMELYHNWLEALEEVAWERGVGGDYRSWEWARAPPSRTFPERIGLTSSIDRGCQSLPSACSFRGQQSPTAALGPSSLEEKPFLGQLPLLIKR